MNVITITAKYAKIGDKIFNRQAKHPAFEWERVWRIETAKSGDIILLTGLREYPTRSQFHPDRCLSVNRNGR